MDNMYSKGSCSHSESNNADFCYKFILSLVVAIISLIFDIANLKVIYQLKYCIFHIGFKNKCRFIAIDQKSIFHDI